MNVFLRSEAKPINPKKRDRTSCSTPWCYPFKVGLHYDGFAMDYRKEIALKSSILVHLVNTDISS